MAKSKIQAAKELQNFQVKPFWPVCGNCPHFQLTRQTLRNSLSDTDYIKETGLYCGVGGFKVGKTSTCDRHPTARIIT